MKITSVKSGLCLLAFMISAAAVSQSEGVSIKTTASAPHASAMLDVESTTKGLLIPRVALTATPTLQSPIPTTPADGLLIYNTNTATPGGRGFFYWDANATPATWKKISGLWDIDPVATPTSVGGIYRKGVVTIGQSTVSTGNSTSSSPLTSTLMVYGPSIFYASGVVSSPANEFGIHVGEPVNHGGVPNGHANEINCYRESLDLQYATQNDVSVGMYRGSNLHVYQNAASPTNTGYGNIYAGTDISAGRYVCASAVVIQTSDSLLKKNITSCTNVLAKLANINTYYYNFNTESDDDTKHIGIMAQQAERQYPELTRDITRTKEDFSDVATGGKSAVITTTVTSKGMDYQGLTSLLLQAIKEQQAQIESLKSRVSYLEGKR